MTTATTTPLPVTTAHRIVGLACRAPSVHNTQPWGWRIDDERIELHADWTRRLEYADPSGRELVISCGAALHHLQVAARALGWAPDVVRMTGDDTSPLAVVTFSPARPAATCGADLDAIRDRCTDRRRFTSWPVPDERLVALAATAQASGARAVAVTDRADRFRVEMLISRAHHVQERDPAIAAEADRWTDHGPWDGVPSTHVPWQPGFPETHHGRFAIGMLDDDDDGELDSGDGVVILHDREDSPAAWLAAGEALSALWLRATTEGLSVVPLSQVVEAQETRDTLRHDLLGGLTVPLLVVRVGWQAISRSHLTPSPRRPLHEVLWS